MEFAGENFLYFGIQQYIDIFKNLPFFSPLPFPPSLSFLLLFFLHYSRYDYIPRKPSLMRGKHVNLPS